jgi:hypothetical protein
MEQYSAIDLCAVDQLRDAELSDAGDQRESAGVVVVVVSRAAVIIVDGGVVVVDGGVVIVDGGVVVIAFGQTADEAQEQKE